MFIRVLASILFMVALVACDSSTPAPTPIASQPTAAQINPPPPTPAPATRTHIASIRVPPKTPTLVTFPPPMDPTVVITQSTLTPTIALEPTLVPTLVVESTP
jgi:hypothetical protein